MEQDKLEALQNLIGEQNEIIEQLKNKVESFDSQIKANKELLEKHKHSGTETANIRDIISEVLGISISTSRGAAESYALQFGGFSQDGRAAVGNIKMTGSNDISFGFEWSGGANPVLTISSLDGIPVYANNAAALGGGLVAGQIYRTNGDPDTICVTH